MTAVRPKPDRSVAGLAGEPRRLVLVVGIVGAFVLLGLAFAGWRVWDGLYVETGEAKAALAGLPYDMRFRSIPASEGLSAVIAGSATARDGTTVNFAVLLGDAGTDSRQAPIVPGAGWESASRLANATVITSPVAIRDGPPGSTETEMEVAIEDAVFDQASLRPRSDE